MAFGLALLIFGIVAIFWRDPIVQLIYSCLSAFLFAIYLIYDT
jgi:FtsH-binding integral membrane protein